MPTQTVSDIVGALTMPALVIGAQETVVASNVPARALLGDHLDGRHYITALRQPMLIEKIETALQDRTLQSGSYHGRDANRDTKYTVQIAPAGQLTILTFEDRTAAQDVDQFRRDFVANVSHELRTPLTALLGFIETLRGAAKDDPEARDRFLDIMEREAGRMTRLVDDLLSLSRVEANERVQPSQHLILATFVKGTVAELAPMIESANTTVRIDDQSGDVAVAAEPGELRQVIANLLENAIKYGAAGQEVLIRISAAQHESTLRGNGVRLTVKDTGQGIASHHIARLTERFYRVDNHRSREIGGTGLGLAIVKHIVNRHRGRLQINSEMGQGTEVTVILPTA